MHLFYLLEDLLLEDLLLEDLLLEDLLFTLFFNKNLSKTLTHWEPGVSILDNTFFSNSLTLKFLFLSNKQSHISLLAFFVNDNPLLLTFLTQSLLIPSYNIFVSYNSPILLSLILESFVVIEIDLLFLKSKKDLSVKSNS